MVVKAELFKEELKIEAKTKNGFSSEESTNCQFGSTKTCFIDREINVPVFYLISKKGKFT